MKMIFFGILVAIAALAMLIQSKPNEFSVTRSAAMQASPEEVFAQINDFRNWNAWSPWTELDPNAKLTYEGPAYGKGAIFRWAGNDKIGEGSNTIIESVSGQLVRIQLDFIKPFKSTSTAEFTFVPEGDNTVVTWTMSGQNNFMSKAISLFMNCDKMVGDQFEKGLLNLKKVVEAL